MFVSAGELIQELTLGLGIEQLLLFVLTVDVAQRGRELAEHMTKTHPGMKALYMSGYTDDATLKNVISETRATFLQKPFSTETLLHRVREVLGRAAAAH